MLPDISGVSGREWDGEGVTAVTNNITFFNFFDYLVVPTLVYELEYPRTDR